MRPVPPTAWYLPVVGVTPVIRGMGGRYAAAFGDASWRGFRYDLVLAAAALSVSLPASASMATTAATYKVVKTIKLGTSARSDDPTGITRLHGQPEVLTLGSRAVRLYPIFHPAAALYTPRMLETLREDFTRLPELLALGAPEQPQALEVPEAMPEAAPAEVVQPGSEIDQLGLF